jgi:hypothetical protein
MKGEDMRQLSLKDSVTGCGSVPVVAVTYGIIDIARRLPGKKQDNARESSFVTLTRTVS